MKILGQQETAQGVRDLILSSPMPEDIKQLLVNEEVMRSQRSLFLCLAQAFMKAFPGLNEDQQIRINAIIYLGSTGIYEADKVYDIQISGASIQEPLVRSHFCFIESQRLLTGLFSANSEFWKVYYKRYWDHFKELKESKQTDRKLDFDEYRNLLKHKYSMIYLIADILYFLTDQKYTDTYLNLIQVMEWFTVGYNIPNEIRGLKTDMDTNINNYAWWRLKEILPEFGIQNDELSSEEMHKMIYLTGLAERMLRESLDAFDQAIAMVRPYGLELLEHIIRKRIESNQHEMEILQEELSSVF
ncbi:MAG: hypothetical protein IPM48_08120 [Saprospiraceae bacterium]|nr:hypothetical protein [Saprospiraceae bacterium]